MNRPLRALSVAIHPPLRRFCGVWVPALGGLLLAAVPVMALPAPGTPAVGTTGAAATPTAPVAPTSPIPNAATKTNATPTDADKALVEKFVADRAAVLGKDDGKARDELVNAASSGSVQNPASTAYLAVLTNTLNRELLPLTTDKDVRVRLNAAIVIAKVAAAAQNAWLQPCVEKLLSDDQKDGVALWGMKAAGAILPQPGAKVDELAARIVKAVAAHPASGAVADEAYSALQVAANPPTAKTIARMQELFKARIAAYDKGIPDEATAERKPCVALTAGGAQGMWTVSTPQQQATTMTLIRDFLRTGAKQADNGAMGDSREQLLSTMQATCTAVQVVAETVGDKILASSAKSAKNSLVPSLPQGQAVPIVAPLLDDITRVFKLPP